MERIVMNNNKEKKGPPKCLLLKTWKKCRSMRNGIRSPTPDDAIARSPKAKSWPRRQVTPEGCFSVYVGPEKEKYVIWTECLNHPLFKSLLDEAEMEYGYATDGPLELPCSVGHFKNVLSEMEHDEDYYDPAAAGRASCNFDYNSYQLPSPAQSAMVYRCQ